MYLIVGLGNPGKEYEGTRHSIGRAIVEAFGKKVALRHAQGDREPRRTIGANNFALNKKWNALTQEGRLGKEKFFLILPETFMNKSGAAVGPAARFYKIKPALVVLVHDDSDIELGRGKLSFNKSSAGHKGVESVMRALKTEAFYRFRIGIQKKRRVEAEKLVLQKFSPDEKKVVTKIIKKTVGAIETLVVSGPDAAMNEYNAQ